MVAWHKKRGEERKPLNVIPVGVADQKVAPVASAGALERLPETVPAAATIDDDQSPGISQDLDARRASTISQNLWAALRYRSACAPEAHLHWWILGKVCRFVEYYDTQMGIATSISAQAPSSLRPSLPAAGRQRALFPPNNTPSRSCRRSSERTMQACRGARRQEQRSRKKGFDEARAPAPCFRWSLECRSVPANMLGIMGNATQRPLDVVSGSSTQIVVGPKWRGHRPDSTRRPALFGTRGLSGTIVRVKP
jgi:hypothetical protein